MTGDYLEVNGERIPKREVDDIIRMFCHDMKEFAGEFHNMERSEKFRANWPDEDVFANCQWRNFFEATRAFYTERLADPLVSEHDKRRMFLAIILWNMVEQAAPEKFQGLQMKPGTEAFEGSKYENRKTVENFGRHSDTFKDLLLGSTRYH